MKENKLKNIKAYVMPFLFLIAGYLYDLRYLIKYGIRMLDSDMASEMILADALNKSHTIITTDWFYSTELRVFETQWFYRLGLLLFPHNWHMARTVAMGMMLALLAFGVFLLGRASGFKQYSLWMAGFAMWPLGAWYCFQTTYGGYYLPYATFSVYALYCIVKLYQKPAKKQKIFQYAFLAFLSLGSGLNGVRQLMVFFAPLLVAALFIMIFYKINILVPTMYAVILNVIGYGINMKVFANTYHFATQDTYAWGGGTRDWLLTIRSFFESFGYCQVCELGYIENDYGIMLFSPDGISKGCGLLIGLFMFFCTLYLIKNFKKLSEIDKIVTSTCISMLVVIGFTFTYLHGAKQYWQQTMVFGFVLLILGIKNFDYSKVAIIGEVITKELIMNFLVCMIAVCTIVSAKGTVNLSIKFPMRAEPNLSKVVHWIETQTDYEFGVTDFWLSNVVTELSNGDIEMYTVTAAYNPVQISEWLQEVSHVESFPPQRYFILVKQNPDPNAFNVITKDLHGVKIYDDGEFVVYGVN